MILTADSRELNAFSTPYAPDSEDSEYDIYNGAKVMVLDDEPAIVDAIAYNLRRQGFVPTIPGHADTALRLLRSNVPDAIILGLMLPSGSGFDVCRLLRQSGNTIPILMLTARVSENDRVQGLESGADDYLVKPFGMRDLMARIRAAAAQCGCYGCRSRHRK